MSWAVKSGSLVYITKEPGAIKLSALLSFEIGNHFKA